MTHRITDILQIIPGGDWFFEDAGQEKTRLADYFPVAVFALVSYADDESSSKAVFKKVIPLDRHNYFDIGEFLGERIDAFDVEIIHRTQIEALLRGEVLRDEGTNHSTSLPLRSMAR